VDIEAQLVVVVDFAGGDIFLAPQIVHCMHCVFAFMPRYLTGEANDLSVVAAGRELPCGLLGRRRAAKFDGRELP
jgi:hypothetical protein